MKKAKRLVSLLLAVVMLLSLAVSAGAAPTGDTPAPTDVKIVVTAENTKAADVNAMGPEGVLTLGTDDTCEIAIKDARVGETYYVYQILYLDSYDKTKEAYSYKANKNWKSWIENTTGTAAAYLTTNANGYVVWNDSAESSPAAAQKFAELAVAEINNSNIPFVASHSPVGAANANIKFTGLQKGYYLITSTLGTKYVIDTYIEYTEVTPKNSLPTLEKLVKDGSTYVSQNSANIGDTITYRSRLTIPTGTKNLTYHDNLSEGLTFTGAESVHIYPITKTTTSATDPVDDVQGAEISKTYYTVETNTPDDCNDLGKCDFHVVFSEEFIQKYINEIGGSALYFNIEYTAILNEKAKVGTANPNPNDAELSYGASGFTTKQTTNTYTFEFPIFKFTKENGVNKPLQGAKFKLLRSTGLASVPNSFSEVDESQWLKFSQAKILVDIKQPKLDADGNPKKDTDGNTIMETKRVEKQGYVHDPVNGTTDPLVSDADGYIYIRGLTPATYRVYETESPAGYNLLAGSTIVDIGASSSATEAQGNMLGHIYQGGALNGAGVDAIGIENKTGNELPETGGIGTTIFYVAGSILLVGAAILLIVKKRMSDEK